MSRTLLLDKINDNLWPIIAAICFFITTAENSNLSGEQKKSLVTDKIKDFLRPFNLPFPDYVLNFLIEPFVDFVVKKYNDLGFFKHR